MQSTTATWRVLTWNILGAKQQHLDAVADVIAGYSPDVVALQEVHRRQATHLARRLGWQVVWTRKHYPLTHLVWWRAEGEAVLSPHRLGNTVHRSISPGVHIYTHRHRVVLAADVRAPQGTLRLYNTHLATGSADERIAQARRIATLITREHPTIAVVAGDLNGHDEPEVIREFHSVGLRDAGGDPTSPAIRPVQRIDYVLVPEAARAIDSSAPDGGQRWHELSDHLPTVVMFSA